MMIVGNARMIGETIMKNKEGIGLIPSQPLVGFSPSIPPSL